MLSLTSVRSLAADGIMDRMRATGGPASEAELHSKLNGPKDIHADVPVECQPWVSMSGLIRLLHLRGELA